MNCVLQMRLLDRARVDVMSLFAINSLYWILLCTRGKNPKENESLTNELVRIVVFHFLLEIFSLSLLFSSAEIKCSICFNIFNGIFLFFNLLLLFALVKRKIELMNKGEKYLRYERLAHFGFAFCTSLCLVNKACFFTSIFY